MKTTLRFFFIVFVVIISAKGFAGSGNTQLWTSMGSGGKNSSGVIFSVNTDGSQGAVDFAFSDTNGINPSGNMIQVGNLLYGTTTSGGHNNFGVLFSFNTKTSIYKVLHYFNNSDGSYPRDLLLGADGFIYGTTRQGGTHTSSTATTGCGVMYSFNPANGAFNLIRDFASNDGENPQGLMQAVDGKIYGMTRQGGLSSSGTIFSYDPSEGSFSSMFSFDNLNGALPTECNLMQATDGNLYGMTTWGGVYDQGVIFRYNMEIKNFTKLYDFPGGSGQYGGTGAYPSGTLLQASDGNLYGLTEWGGQYQVGVIFTYNLSSLSYSSMFNFNGINGANPLGGLIQISDGLLYGTTTNGGVNGTGVIFNYNYYSSSYNVVSNCDGTTGGGTPMSNLLQLAAPTAIDPVATPQISLYPNPATDQLILRTGDFKPEQILVRDINGQPIMESAYTNHLDISTLAAGIYFIEIKDNASSGRSKFIKL